MPVPSIFRWFWVVILVVIAINGFLYRERLRRLEEAGGITAAESSRVLRILGLGGGGLCLALLAVQLAAGWPSPLCLYDRPLADPFVLASLAVNVGAMGGLLAWIFVYGGAELMSRASPAMSRRGGGVWSPAAVRAITALVMVAGLAGFLMARLGSSPGLCEIPPAAAPR